MANALNLVTKANPVTPGRALKFSWLFHLLLLSFLTTNHLVYQLYPSQRLWILEEYK